MKIRNRTSFLTVYGNLLLLGFIIFLWVFTSPIRVYANEPDGTTPYTDTSSAAIYTVVGIEDSEQLSNLAPFELVRRSLQNTEPLFYHVYNNGLLNVNAIIEDSDGNTTTKTLRVSWSCWDDSTTVTNTTVCGEYIETGTILLPDDSYTWGEGVLSVLSLPVKVYDPEEPVEIVKLEEVWNEFDTAFSLEQNSSIEDLLSSAPLQTTWPCYDATGNEYLCPVVYNTEDVSEDMVGIYNITATFEAPLNCRFSDSITIPSFSIPVTVQTAGQPQLNLSYLNADYSLINFPWITTGIDLDTMEVWMSENGGEWQMIDPDSGDVEIHSTMLRLYVWLLNEGSSYRIQVDYEGGQTGIASFTYEWDMLSDKDYIEGDRDGGDTEGNPPKDGKDTDDNPPKDGNNTDDNPPKDSGEDAPDEEASAEDSNSEDKDSDATPPAQTQEPVVPSAPTTALLPFVPSDSHMNTSNGKNNKTAKKTSTPTDTVDREESYLLGSELDLMLEKLGVARFSSESIMLDIPQDAIASLNISDTDRLLVNILPLENNGFSIDILINDITISALSAMRISLPYQPAKNTTPVLIHADGTVIAEGSYDESTGIVTFIINKTGTFF